MTQGPGVQMSRLPWRRDAERVQHPRAFRGGRLLGLRALFKLIAAHRAIRAGRFQQIFSKRPAVRAIGTEPPDVDALVSAVDRACAWYIRPSNCFHRSAALMSLLMEEGCDAKVILGIRFEPYAGHAWVELDGRVLNDDASVRNEYQEIESLTRSV